MPALSTRQKPKSNFIFAIAFLIALVMCGGIIVSIFMDWEKFKPTIEAKISDAIGRKVHIQGKMSGMLLPMTQVTAENIVIDNIDGGKAPQFLKMESLEVQLSPLSLLTGSIEIGYVHLKSPEIHLEKFSDDKNNWNFAAKSQPAADKKPAPTDKSVSAIPQLHSLKIEKGKVFYADYTTGTKQTVTDLDLDADLNLPSRKASIDATGDWQGQKSKIKLAIKPAKENQLAANLSANIPMGELTFDGTMYDPMQGGNKPLTSAGNFKFAVNATPKIEALGKLNYTPDEIKIVGLQISGADMKGQGDITVKMQNTPFVDAKLNFDTVDVAKLMAAVKSWQSDLAPAVKADAKTAAAAKTGGGLNVRGNFNIGVDKLNLTALTASNVKIQAATMDGRTIALQRFALQTMGDTNIEASGDYNLPASSFDGKARLDIGNLQKLADAAGFGGNDWVKAQPSRVEFTSGVQYAGQKINLKNYNLQNGDLKSSGELGYVMGDNPEFDIRAAISHPSIKKLFAKPDLPVDSKLALNTDLTGRLNGSGLNYGSMQGKVRAELNDGILKGVDWKKVSLEMKEINDPRDLLRVLDQVQRQKDGLTPFRSLTSDWTVVRGVATSNNIALDSDVVKMNGGGNIKLEDQQMDINARVTFNDHPKVPALGVRTFGAVTAPQYAFDTTAIASYYANKAINKAIEKNVDVNKLQQKIDKQGGKLLKKLMGQ
ncbi:MAG: AsmA family protein [Alphaproteobacteria bacterium]|nr:MAG: AsmA family protein [Alphaproteobacteria bacterium]